ncbi:MAG TPA: 2-phospho-L-lactate guanylyltransferase [Micropepsaceae bacterium]|nr:2-phospho-L-lactate guanylyltransferase [Micropepsaceae bacterium]
MKAIVIPVKAFAAAKTRLSPFLSPDARAGLAEAMCRDVFTAVARVRRIDRVLVVSNEPRALAWAKERNWEILAEQQQISESASVDLACRHCLSAGAKAVLRLPADIPLVCSSDIEELFAALSDSPGCVIVPSRDGTGTNALLRSPATAFGSHFGRDSFAAHLAAARAAGLPVTVVRNAHIELDVDEPADLEQLRQLVPANFKTGEWLRGAT